ncbi:lytic murein transglycosylase [Labrys wisconsinensis]|uniref:Lytic murein transglycosylase n=1 Tax=Labrys wisconsinensis TaxID=425677 RepID=A0ABU0JJK1_9HYPH|nr:lytic murein transglycosylase [Labrys wisconsinensis]MDQ0474439.1 lytic murein transglycosylase [Labrys wisconsinensis]
MGRIGGGLVAGALLAFATAAGPAQAASCQPQPFAPWLQGVRQEAAAKGISQGTIAAALDGITFDPAVVSRDRGQSVFSQTFLEFAGRMVARYRLQKAASLMKANARIFARIEQQYGVPAPVIAAFWGLETDFGAVMGNLPTLRSLATLAYDCRRPQMFRAELLDALEIIERGDLTAAEMVGPWAGELGQFQFQPSYYVKYAVDFDGDGRRDLIRSTPDALASAGNFLASLGWQRGQPWLQEVRVPAEMRWEEADLAIEHPRSQWAAWGVKAAGGALPADAMPASLLLPMGRNGPAFLAYPNFRVYLKWNQSLIYATTAAYFATRLSGAPAVSRGNGPVAPMDYREIKALQQLLVKGGYEVGEVDGKLGAVTRDGVKKAQLKFGLPADSYPTPELVERLRSGR